MTLLLAAILLAGATPALQLERLDALLDAPIDVQAAPGDHRRLFIAENEGQIRIFRNGQLEAKPFLDLRGQVAIRPGNGLLSFTFHPRYNETGWVYVSFVRKPDLAKRVVRYTVSSTDPDQLDPSSAFELVEPIAAPGRQHHGGSLAFGPDGKLYITSGDGGAPDPSCRAQNFSLLLGKLLRLNDDGSIPSDNPFIGDEGARDEVFAVGLRNPWRMSFDRANGDMWLGDVGQSRQEELNRVPFAQAAGANFGWQMMEGTSCYEANPCGPNTPKCGDPSLVLPIHTFEHDPMCAMMSGYVYRGCAMPALQGSFFFGDYCTGRVWSLRQQDGHVTELIERTKELSPFGTPTPLENIVSFGQDDDGELYFADYIGSVFKLTSRDPLPVRDLGYSKPPAQGAAPVLTACGGLALGQSMRLRVEGAPPGADIQLYLSHRFSPHPAFGGTLVTGVPARVVPLVADSTGDAEFWLSGEAVDEDVYAQAVIRSTRAFTQGLQLLIARP